MKKRNVLKNTEYSSEYNRVLKYEMSFSGEVIIDGYMWHCDCPNHRRYWTMKRGRDIKKYFNRQRSWKKYRKTQYKP